MNGNSLTFSRFGSWLWLPVFTLFFYLMLRITLQYFPMDAQAAFLQIKQTEVTSVPSYLPIFYIHVCSSIFVLLAGFTQFRTRLLAARPQLHRYGGRLYGYTVLLFSAPSGIYIGLHANGGLAAKISFVTLGLLWFWFTLKGIDAARKRAFPQHRKWMLRSFALAFSAVTLRLWKVVLVFVFEPNPMDVYQLIAWLGWIPNLLLIELLFTLKRKP